MVEVWARTGCQYDVFGLHILALSERISNRSALDYTLGGFPQTEQDRAKEEAASFLDEAWRTPNGLSWKLTPGCESELIFGLKY